MGLGGTLVKMMSAILGTKGNAPGPSVIVNAEGYDGQTFEPEVYQAPGVMALPGDGSKGVWIPIGGSNRYGVVLAMQNYSLNIEISAGETAIYSTAPDGSSVQALVKLTDDGKIYLNGDSKAFVTHAELNTALQTFITALNLHVHTGSALGLGIPFNTTPPTPMSLDISAAATTTVKTGG